MTKDLQSMFLMMLFKVICGLIIAFQINKIRVVIMQPYYRKKSFKKFKELQKILS